jgi:hypothetical protein
MLTPKIIIDSTIILFLEKMVMHREEIFLFESARRSFQITQIYPLFLRFRHPFPFHTLLGDSASSPTVKFFIEIHIRLVKTQCK